MLYTAVAVCRFDQSLRALPSGTYTGQRAAAFHFAVSVRSAIGQRFSSSRGYGLFTWRCVPHYPDNDERPGASPHPRDALLVAQLCSVVMSAVRSAVQTADFEKPRAKGYGIWNE